MLAPAGVERPGARPGAPEVGQCKHDDPEREGRKGSTPCEYPYGC